MREGMLSFPNFKSAVRSFKKTPGGLDVCPLEFGEQKNWSLTHDRTTMRMTGPNDTSVSSGPDMGPLERPGLGMS